MSLDVQYKIHHQAKYQRLNVNTLYAAAILFFRSSLHRESLPSLPNYIHNTKIVPERIMRVTAVKRYKVFLPCSLSLCAPELSDWKSTIYIIHTHLSDSGNI